MERSPATHAGLFSGNFLVSQWELLVAAHTNLKMPNLPLKYETAFYILYLKELDDPEHESTLEIQVVFPKGVRKAFKINV